MSGKKNVLQVVALVAAMCTAAVLAGPPQWQAAPSLNTPREQFGAAVDEAGSIFIAGGYNRTGGCGPQDPVYNLTIEMLAFDRQSWTYAPAWTILPTQLPINHISGTAVIVGRFLYLIGGLSALDAWPPLAQVDRYDLITGSWDSAPPLTTARGGHTTVVDRAGRIWVIGGQTASAYDTASTEFLDTARPGLGWQTGPSLNESRLACGSSVDSDGRLYVVGGAYAAGHRTSCERLDPFAAGGWQLNSPGIPPLPPPTLFDAHAVTGADGMIYEVAGYSSQGWTHRTIRLDLNPNAFCDPTGWQTRNPLTMPRDLHGLVLGADGYMYAIGGDYMYEGVYCRSIDSVEKLDTRRPVGDINGDTFVDFEDINPFVCLLTHLLD